LESKKLETTLAKLFINQKITTMSILIKNRTTVPECGTENKSIIDDRISEADTDLLKIRDEIMDFHYTAMASSNEKIKT
jgi:hypothetical protein